MAIRPDVRVYTYGADDMRASNGVSLNTYGMHARLLWDFMYMNFIYSYKFRVKNPSNMGKNKINLCELWTLNKKNGMVSLNDRSRKIIVAHG
jgi:hypothetical protein